MTGRELINWIHESGLEELPIFRIGRRAIVMNGRQAAREAAKKLAEAEYMNKCAAIDIQGYVACVLHMIKGGSPCDWCEERNECQLQAKEEGKGCELWWLKYPEKEDQRDDATRTEKPEQSKEDNQYTVPE